MASNGFAGCVVDDTEEWEDGEEDPPIRAIHPYPGICWK
jgi:hypothetical protein